MGILVYISLFLLVALILSLWREITIQKYKRQFDKNSKNEQVIKQAQQEHGWQLRQQLAKMQQMARERDAEKHKGVYQRTLLENF